MKKTSGSNSTKCCLWQSAVPMSSLCAEGRPLSEPQPPCVPHLHGHVKGSGCLLILVGFEHGLGGIDQENQAVPPGEPVVRYVEGKRQLRQRPGHPLRDHSPELPSAEGKVPYRQPPAPPPPAARRPPPRPARRHDNRTPSRPWPLPREPLLKASSTSVATRRLPRTVTHLKSPLPSATLANDEVRRAPHPAPPRVATPSSRRGLVAGRKTRRELPARSDACPGRSVKPQPMTD